jgi:hypothetical protein
VRQALDQLLKKLTIASGMLAAAACSSDYLPSKEFLEEGLDIFGRQEIVCPNVRILRAGETYFVAEPDSESGQLSAVAEIETVQVSCRLEFPKREETTTFMKFAVLVTEVDIAIRYISDARNKQDISQSLPYFVALVNRFGKITGKSIFESHSTWNSVEPTGDQVVHETVVVKLPIDTLDEAEGYEMLVSFQLSKLQIENFRERDRH